MTVRFVFDGSNQAFKLAFDDLGAMESASFDFRIYHRYCEMGYIGGTPTDYVGIMRLVFCLSIRVKKRTLMGRPVGVVGWMIVSPR